jgi:hypothetical protein
MSYQLFMAKPLEEKRMETSAISRKAAINRIVQLSDCLIEQGYSEADMVSIFEYLILESRFTNAPNEVIMGWLPNEVLAEVLGWLEMKGAESEKDCEEEAEDEV